MPLEIALGVSLAVNGVLAFALVKKHDTHLKNIVAAVETKLKELPVPSPAVLNTAVQAVAVVEHLPLAKHGDINGNL